MRCARYLLEFGLVLGVVSACQAEPEAGARDGVAEAHASCRELAQVTCGSRALCAQATFASEYGTAEECIGRQSELCVGTWFAEGSSARPADVRACAEASDLGMLPIDEHCRQWLDREVLRNAPTACRPRGGLADGAPCVSGVQCAAETCRPLALCGRCGPLRSRNEHCVEGAECKPGLACTALTCNDFADEGSSCAEARCKPWLGCHFGACMPRAGAGAPCDRGGDSCQRWPVELACSHQSETCQPLELRGQGEPCGALAGGTLALCEHGFACRATSGPKSGVCVPLVEDGLSCEHAGPFVFGGPCRAPAECIAGACQLRVGSTCREELP